MSPEGISAKQPETIRGMFDQISSSYDLANTVLSGGIHLLWKRKLVRESGVRRGQKVLDCATGTGDLALYFQKAVGSDGEVIATDFSEGMLQAARARHDVGNSASASFKIRFEQADVQQLPYEAARFDVACISFGIRNVQDPVRALQELGRVVKPGGRVMVLEFGQPRAPIWGSVYRFYSNRVLPTLGGILSGKRDAYRYLNESSAAFPAGELFLDLARKAGVFSKMKATSLTGGVAWIYLLEVADTAAVPSQGVNNS